MADLRAFVQMVRQNMVVPLQDMPTAQLKLLDTTHDQSVSDFQSNMNHLFNSPALFTGQMAQALNNLVGQYYKSERELSSYSSDGLSERVSKLIQFCQNVVADLPPKLDALQNFSTGPQQPQQQSRPQVADANGAPGPTQVMDPTTDPQTEIQTLSGEGLGLLVFLGSLGIALTIADTIQTGQALDIYNTVHEWEMNMNGLAAHNEPALPANADFTQAVTADLTNMAGLNPLQQKVVNDAIAWLTANGYTFDQAEIEALARMGYGVNDIIAILKSGSSGLLQYALANRLTSAQVQQLVKAIDVARLVMTNAQKGKIKRAKGEHGRLPDTLVQDILSHPDEVYLTTGKNPKYIFRKGDNIVIVDGPGSGQGNIITSYGPAGERGTSGASIYGGKPTDPGLPVTDDMIRNGKIPIAGGGGQMFPPAIPILP